MNLIERFPIDNSDIGFIVAVLGTAFGIIGALFGHMYPLKLYKGCIRMP